MNRKTIIALLLFFGLLAAVYLIQRQPEKGERQGERPRPFAPLQAERIKQVTITKGQSKVVLEQSKDGWTLVEPLRYPADKYAAETMAGKLEKLEFGDIVSELPAKHASYEVDSKAGLRVTVADGQQQLADFYLGKTLEGFTLLRVVDQDQVFQAVGSLRSTFEREVKGWRDRSIAQVKKEEVRQLTVSSEAGTIVLGRQDDKAPWKVESSPAPIDKLDVAAINSLLGSLTNLSAADFADGVTSQQSGLESPAAKITVKLKEGEPLTLLLGGQKGEERYLQREGQAQVYLLGKYPAQSLLKRPVDFRDKTVLSFKPEDVVGLTLRKGHGKGAQTAVLTRKGEGWLVGGKPAKQADRVKQALETLSTLKAEGFAAEGPAAFGLDSPQWTLELQLKDRTRHKLLVGSKESSGLHGLTRAGLPEIFTLRKHLLDRFLLEPASL